MKYLSPFAPGIDDKSANPFLPVPINIAYKRGIHVPLIIGTLNKDGLYGLDGILNIYFLFFLKLNNNYLLFFDFLDFNRSYK